MKYLVMECARAYAVVLADDGSFIKVANMRYEVGQTVADVVPLNLPEQPVKRGYWGSSLAAVAACLVLIVSMMFLQAPCASVYLTINPEVRIDVNRGDMVVGVAGVNDDGAVLLAGYDYHRKSLDTVMDELVDRAIAMGYLSDGGTVTLALDADEEWVVSHSAHLDQRLHEHLTDKISVTIEITGHHGHGVVIPVAPSGADHDSAHHTQPATHPVPDTGHDDHHEEPDHDGDPGYDEENDGDSGCGEDD